MLLINCALIFTIFLATAGTTYYAWLEISSSEVIEDPHWPLQVSNGSVQDLYPVTRNILTYLLRVVGFSLLKSMQTAHLSFPILISAGALLCSYYSYILLVSDLRGQAMSTEQPE